MDKDYGNNNLKSSVTFTRNHGVKGGHMLFYKLEGEKEIHEVTTIALNKLREMLNVPFKVQFYGMSKANVAFVLARLKDDTMNVEIISLVNKKNNLKRFEATFTRIKKFVEAYKVPNVSLLYSRSTNCNPYLYTEINSHKILIEVSKDYAKNNEGDYYFLSSDLSECEQEFFDILYTELEYDNIYKLEKEPINTKRKNKRLK